MFSTCLIRTCLISKGQAKGPIRLLPYITPSCPATGHSTADMSGLAHAGHAGTQHRGTQAGPTTCCRRGERRLVGKACNF